MSDATTKQCSACRVHLPVNAFWRNRSRPGGLAACCRECEGQRMRRYRASLPPEERRERERKQYHRDPRKRMAKKTVWCALKSGRLVRPDGCDSCGALGAVDAHHHMGYERKHWLDVKWVCRTCHANEHRGTYRIGQAA